MTTMTRLQMILIVILIVIMMTTMTRLQMIQNHILMVIFCTTTICLCLWKKRKRKWKRMRILMMILWTTMKIIRTEQTKIIIGTIMVLFWMVFDIDEEVGDNDDEFELKEE